MSEGLRLEHAVTIDAPIGRVWEALTSEKSWRMVLGSLKRLLEE